MQNGQVSSDGITENDVVSEKGWWKDRSILERRLIVAALVALGLVLLVFFIYLAVSNHSEVCTTPTCVRTSMELLTYMDPSLDPCRDFYRFACAKFLRNTNLDNNNGRRSRSVKDVMVEEVPSQIRNMLEEVPLTAGSAAAEPSIQHLEPPDILEPAKRFYRACMNRSAIERIGLKGVKQIFRQIGGWPVLNANWREDLFSWIETLRELRLQGIYLEIFVKFDVQRDKAIGSTSRYILALGKPHFVQYSTFVKNRDAYLEYMISMAIIFGASRDRAQRDQEQVMQFMMELIRLSEEDLETETSYNPMSLSELQYAYRGITWRAYVNGILAPASGIGDDDIISVSSPAYLGKLIPLLGRTNKRVLANFIAWKTVEHLVPFISTKEITQAHDTFRHVAGNTERKPIWQNCVELTTSRFRVLISAAYIRSYFDDESRMLGVSMMAEIKRQFRENLIELDWLDEKTKELALHGLASTVEEVVSYENLLDRLQVYEQAYVNEEDFLNSTLNLDFINTNIKFGRLHQTAYDFHFEEPEFVTGLNITFSRKENVLRLPAGVFQNPLFRKDRPRFMNYGALGTIIAHEIYHVITEAEYRDSTGGELRSWWSSHSLLNYGQKLQCLAGRYGRYIMAKIEEPVNISSANKDEDMADLAGLKISYDAYTTWVHKNGPEPHLPGLDYTPYQLFWISSAVPHCTKRPSTDGISSDMEITPEKIRVNSALENLYEFARDFRCPSGSQMNPEEKCHVW